MPDSDWLTLDEALKATGIDPKALWTSAEKGELPYESRRVGLRRLVSYEWSIRSRRSDLEAWQRDRSGDI